jgi:hypothetical protein
MSQGRRMRLRQRAFAEAAALLVKDASCVDLGDDLSEEDEEFVREYLRIEISKMLRKRAGEA